jgi:DNA-binding beta-propeller fold protein YncE
VTSEGLYVATRSGTVYAIGPPRDTVIAAPALEDGLSDSTVARPLWKSSGGPNALGNPTGIAVAPTGEIWVCDTANDRLQVFDAEGNFLREFGSHGAGPGQFDFGVENAEFDGHSPLEHRCSLAFDESGALYVADAANHRVQRFQDSVWQSVVHACCALQVDGTPMPYPTSGGMPDLVIGVEGTDAGEFLFASDVAIAPNGDIYIGDRRRVDVQRFDVDGTYLETIGKPVGIDPMEVGTFISIGGIALDDQGRLYIVDEGTKQIDRLELDGSWTTLSLKREESRINGIAVDEFGNIFLAQLNAIGGSFTIHDQNGTLLDQVGSYGIELGQFDASSGLALDGLGNIYVTDWALNRFQKFVIDYDQLQASAEESST